MLDEIFFSEIQGIEKPGAGEKDILLLGLWGLLSLVLADAKRTECMRRVQDALSQLLSNL